MPRALLVYNPAAELSPYALLDDGTMDLWLFEGSGLEDTVQLVWELWSGRHLHSDRVHRIPFRRAVLESDSPLYVQADGEPVKGNGQVKIEVRPQAVRVLVPEDTPRSLFRNPPVVRLEGLQ